MAKTNVGRKLVTTEWQRKKSQLVTLLPRHYRILDLFIEGKSIAQVAMIVEMSARQIGMIRQSPLFQTEYSRRRKAIEDKHDGAVVIAVLNAGDRLSEASNNAADVLVNGLLDCDIQVKLRSAESILDRTGYGKQTKTENSNISLVANLSVTQIDNLESTLKMLEESSDAERTTDVSRNEAKV